MPQETFDKIPELLAAEFVSVLMRERGPANRLEIVHALSAWIAILLQDSDSETRIDAAHALAARAVWLAPGERFDAETFRVLDEARAEILSIRERINNNEQVDA